eukprot:2101310-Pyramimonas_sp.AAC.1
MNVWMHGGMHTRLGKDVRCGTLPSVATLAHARVRAAIALAGAHAGAAAIVATAPRAAAPAQPAGPRAASRT